jgi:hypothetical protein
MAKLRFCKTLNFVFKNYFFKSHILKSHFLKSQIQMDLSIIEKYFASLIYLIILF